MARPTGRPGYSDRPLREQAAGWVGRIFKSGSKADVAIGPAQLAATHAVFAVAGLCLGILPGALMAIFGGINGLSALMLAFLPPLGLIVGLLVAIPARGLRLGIGRFGIIGATLLALLFIVASCSVIGTAAAKRDMQQAMQSWEKAEEMGLPIPKGIERQRSAPPAPSLQERTTKFVAGKLAPAWSFAQHNMWIFPVIGGVLLIGGLFTIIALFVYGERRGYM